MYETLVRQHDLAAYQMPTLEDAVDKLKHIESRKKSRREYQRAKSMAEKTESQKRKAGEMEAGSSDEKVSAKKFMTTDGEEAASAIEDCVAEASKEDTKMESIEETAITTQPTTTEKKKENVVEKKGRDDWKKPSDEERRYQSTKPAPQGRGHTSYLTFASLMPLPQSQ